jgi:2-dehydropantoate 2-reductase
MKICVVGAGAIGGLFAGKLAAAGHEVSAIARGAHLAALQTSGLRLIEPAQSGLFSISATDNPTSLGKQDLLVIALKAQQIAAVLPSLAQLLHEQTVVLPAINGLPWWYCHADLATAARGIKRIECLDPSADMPERLPLAHIVGCVVHASAEVSAPGVITANGQNKLVIGEPSHSVTERATALAALLSDAGFNVKLSARIRDDVWMKLVGNASFNPIAALTQSRMDQLNASDAIIQLVRRMMEEIVAVARAYGCDPLVGIDERIAIGRSIGPVKISMHQDLERGRPLELDAIVRAPLELGLKAGIAMPFTQSVLALADELNKRLLLKI